MSIYIKLDENGNIEDSRYSIFKLKRDNPTVSFPTHLTEGLLNSYNVHKVIIDPQEVDIDETKYKTVANDVPVKKEDGNWHLVSTVAELTEEEKQNIYTSHAGLNKDERDIRLMDTDWWALSDTPDMTPEQTAYRQALRDLSSHANWPHLDEADWPTKP